MDSINNNAEQIISGISDVFEDLSDLPDGQIKESLEKIKQLDEENKRKKIKVYTNNENKE